MEIPNYGKIEAKTVIFDLNGTLGAGGKVSREVKELLKKLSGKYTVVVLSADTFGTLKEEFEGLTVKVERVIIIQTILPQNYAVYHLQFHKLSNSALEMDSLLR